MRSRRHGSKKNSTEDTLLESIEHKAYLQFKTKMIQSVKEDLMAGMKAEDILKKYEAYAAATLVSSLINPKDAVQAAEKLMDRTQGKAVQRNVSTHKFERLSEEELDSLLQSKLSGLEGPQEDDPQKIN